MNNTFTKINGLSDVRRLPLLGKIRLGLKVESQKTGKQYPKETEYFVCPEEVKKVYGEFPTELEVMMPVENRGIIFPQAYRRYGQTKGLKCIGNGMTANEFDDKTKQIIERECPCILCKDYTDEDKEYAKANNGELPKKECTKRAFLFVILPKVNVGGVYQLTTSSYNSIIDINSGLDYIQAMFGRIALIPLKLKRKPVETHYDQKKQTHYCLKLEFEGSIDFLNQLRENTKRILLEQQERPIALPAPKDENPESEPVDIIESEGITDEENNKQKETVQEQQTEKPKTVKVLEFIEKENLSGVHLKVLWEKICALLDKHAKKTKENQLRLLANYDKAAEKPSDLKREQMFEMYYDLVTEDCDLDSICIPW